MWHCTLQLYVYTWTKQIPSHPTLIPHRMELEAFCQLDMMLLYETVEESIMQVLLPINTMRNYALIQVCVHMGVCVCVCVCGVCCVHV